jgi:hypothetical protein
VAAPVTGLPRTRWWDANAARDFVRTYAAEALDNHDAVRVVDKTGSLKKGAHSVGVARQYFGKARRIERCQIGVFVAGSQRPLNGRDAGPGHQRRFTCNRWTFVETYWWMKANGALDRNQGHANLKLPCERRSNLHRNVPNAGPLTERPQASRPPRRTIDVSLTPFG